jgi:hypothetical protein
MPFQKAPKYVHVIIRYGYSRDHHPERRQVVIGVVMTRDGIPLCHHVFHGATPDKSTVQEMVKFVMAYNPEVASAVRKRREAALERANAFIQDVRARLRKAQEGKARARPLTREGAAGDLGGICHFGSQSREARFNLAKFQKPHQIV